MKKTIFLIILIILVATGAFYAGMKYNQSKSLSRRSGPLNFQNLPFQERQRIRSQTDSNFVRGEIISKDDQSLTIKIPNGGSRIIFYSDQTEINKFIKGSLNDLEIGKTVIINGKANEDGSITARFIELRP